MAQGGTQTFTPPEPFNTLQSYQSAYDSVNAITPLNTTKTNYPALLTDVINYTPWIIKLPHQRTSIEVSGLCSDMLTKSLRKAGPIAAQVWCLSKKFVTRAHHIMSTNKKIATLSATYDAYLAPASECTDATQIELYGTCCKEFRKWMGNLIVPHSGMETLVGPTELTLKAGGVDLGVLQEMLLDMETKRAKNLPSRAQKMRGVGTGAKHAEEYITSLTANLDGILTVDISRRRKTVDNMGWDIITNSAVPSCLLLTTAILYDRQKNNSGDKYTKIMRDFSATTEVGRINEEIFKSCLVEVDIYERANVRTGPVKRSGFKNQGSNIDSLFLAFFMAFKILDLSIEQFYAFQRFFYALGQRIEDRNQVAWKFNQYATKLPGVALLSRKLSASNKIHLPPWIMNIPRLQDMVAVIGAVDTYNYNPTVKVPGISLRYLYNLKREDSFALGLVVTYYIMEKKGIELDRRVQVDCIMQSEICLHQLLLPRKSPLQNTNFIGNTQEINMVE